MKTDPGLLQRLQFVATRHSQSDIARRTGTGVSNVHHYLNGTRVPADFCIALVRQLGVSAQWLLTGEGVPYTADAAPDAGHFADEVKRLSRALDAASRLRLGELHAGKRTRALAEINDALDAHADAQRRVSAQVREPLSDLFQSIREAMYEHDRGKPEALARMDSQLKSARLLMRLTDDPSCVQEFTFFDAQLMIRQARFADALAQTRRAFLMSLSTVGPASHKFVDALIAYASGAVRLGYLREARMVLDTGVAMARKAGRSAEQVAFEDVYRAMCAAETGSLDGTYALARAALELGLGHGAFNPTNAVPLVSNIAMMAGVSSFEDALGEARNVYQLRHLCAWAAWLEDPSRLRKLLKVRTEDMTGVPTVTRRLFEHWSSVGRFVLRAAWDQPRGLWREFDTWAQSEVSSGAPEKDSLERAIRSTQIARLCNEARQAGVLLQEADRQLNNLPTGMEPFLLDRATHYRNALVLGGTASAPNKLKHLRAQAQTWFRSHTAAGYKCFAGFGV